MTRSERSVSRLSNTVALLLIAAFAAACTSDTPTITGVSVQADSPRLRPGSTVRLVATVSGSGRFDAGVSWAIEYGGGTLSSEEGAEVTYLAPESEGSWEVVIRATSRVDPTVSGTAKLAVSSERVADLLITAVPTTLPPGGTASVVAFVDGLGVFNRDVTWKLIEGSGQFHQMDNRSAEFQAAEDFTGQVILEASSNEDPSRKQTVTLTVERPLTDSLSTRIRAPGCEVDRGAWGCTGVPAHDSSTLLASITSAHEFNALARIPGTDLQAPLAYSTADAAYSGALDLRSLNRGQYPLEVAVSDTQGHTLITPATFVLDRPPRLEVTEPATWQMVGSSLRIRATCGDDSTECSLTASVLDSPGTARPTALGTLDTTLELAAAERNPVPLHIIAEDSLGQTTSRTFSLFVADPALEAVARVPGQLVDADASRLLFTTGGGPNTAATGLALIDRTSGQLQTLPMPTQSVISQARLTTSAALFLSESVPASGLGPRLYLYRNDGFGHYLLFPVETDRQLLSFTARGDLALWMTHPDNELLLRHLVSDATVRVAVAGVSEHDVAENGLVAFMDPSYDIVTYRDNVTRRLTDDPDDRVRNGGPLTDGKLVVYNKVTVCCGTPTLTVALHTGEQEILLTPPRPLGPTYTPGRSYAVHAGWVAYIDLGSNGQRQVWLRSPEGETRQVTDFSTATTIEALGPEGRLAVRNVVNGKANLHVSRADGTLQDLGPVEGRALWLQDAWHVLWADTLFRVR
ncbi:hypothetical protein [Hyalangium rubrum]|uniref:Uncharacterized protein n=1 Tax=Hyalangium rubrum TaxID=3103134 RepID=A0ABU5HB32_9BACT|nr:hypothetical protein [Hyalangium sp. s54d21]MDY7230084.1 hypothetical protein [Hyalangium sp. s54d21]